MLYVNNILYNFINIVAIVGNKIDKFYETRTDSKNIHEFVNREELNDFARQIGAISMEISAKEGNSFEQLFKLIQFKLFDPNEDDQKKKKKDDTKEKKKDDTKKCKCVCDCQ